MMAAGRATSGTTWHARGQGLLSYNGIKKRVWHAATSVPSYARLGLWAARHPGRARRIRELMRRPIVIGGCGRSGTTLLLSVLSCHSRIFAIDRELDAFCPDAYSAEPDLTVPTRWDWLWRYFADTEIPPSCSRWCEKTPKNVVVFDRILRAFGEDVRLIHIVRDGRAVVTSRHPQDPTRYHVSPERWVTDVSAGLRVEPHPQVLRVRYEDLVLDPTATMRTICEFLDEEYEDAIAGYPGTAKVRSHAAWSSGATRLSPDSLETWKQPEHRQVVSRLLAIPEADELLHELGYL
jgi:hypothetical protein